METNLAKARKKAGYTQKALAKEIEISENGYQRYELGLREPKAKIANRIARALNSTSEELFGT